VLKQYVSLHFSLLSFANIHKTSVSQQSNYSHQRSFSCATRMYYIYNVGALMALTQS